MRLCKRSIDLDRMLNIFYKYCENDSGKISRAEFAKNLDLKRDHPDFNIDMKALLPLELNWDFNEAFDFVQREVVSQIE